MTATRHVPPTPGPRPGARTAPFAAAMAAMALLILGASRPAAAENDGPANTAPGLAAAQPIILNDDAGWCWFQDERAIFAGNKLITGTVASGSRDPSRKGDIDVNSIDLATGEVLSFTLHKNLENDDHDAPALIELPGGRILAVYSRHGTDKVIRHRTTAEPGDIGAWSEEKTFRIGALFYGPTYSNVYRLAGTGEIYDFHRGRKFNPNAIVSRDNGRSWKYAGLLLKGKGRPYARYASNNVDTVHFIVTEQHPRDFDNSLYHGYVRGGLIHDSFGNVVGELGRKPAAHAGLTRFFAGDADNVAWPADADLDESGKLYVVYSVQKDGAGLLPGRGGMDHRYRYAVFDGEQWQDHEIGFAGSKLYAGEDDYTGLACLHPGEPGTVYFSADVDPASGDPLISAADGERHYELWKGVTSDGGESWVFTPITRDSAEDQIRPNVPIGGPPGSALIWLRGELETYRRYDLEQVVLVPAP